MASSPQVLVTGSRLLLAEPGRLASSTARFVPPPRPLDVGRARRQWDDLRGVLESLQHDVHVLPGDPTPFVADAVVTGPSRGTPAFACGRLRGDRASEVAPASAWLRAHGHRRLLWTAAGLLAGGDLSWSHGMLLAGFGGVSTQAAGRAAAAAFGVVALPLHLVDDRWPVLDEALCVLDDERALWVPEAFDEGGRAALESLFPHLEAVPAAGCIPLGEHVVVDPAHGDTVRAVASLGFEPVRVDLSAWRPAGGCASSLVCRVRG